MDPDMKPENCCGLKVTFNYTQMIYVLKKAPLHHVVPFQYFEWAEAIMTDSPDEHPDDFCDLTNFDGGMKDGINKIRFMKEGIPCRCVIHAN